MDKENNLIFEAYITESRRVTSLAMAMMCALGFGGTSCKTMTLDQQRNMEDTINLLGSLVPLFGKANLSPEQQQRLNMDIQQQLQLGNPEKGWETWYRNWLRANSNVA